MNSNTNTEGGKMNVTARLSGETAKIRTLLSAAGWKWMPIFQSWVKDVDGTHAQALMAGEAQAVKEAVKAIGANMKGCVLMIDAGGMPKEVWRSKTYVAPTREGEAKHIGCDACGDHVPARRTPRGWLCYDCAKDA